ncbi:MAG: HEAT repeat domain-containing protein, partial [Planctomycetota bacterium]
SADSHREYVRHGAVDGLAKLGDPRAVDLVIPLLDHRYGRGAMSAMRHAAMDCLFDLAPDDARTHAAVVGLLDDPYFRMRGWAANACGRFLVRKAIPRLEKMRDGDRHRGNRNAAKRALEKMGVKVKKAK